MYYQESERIASNHPSLKDTIVKVDSFLYKQEERSFSLVQTADILRINPDNLRGVLNFYKNIGAVNEKLVFLCPTNHYQELEYVDYDLYCPLCDDYYTAEQCRTTILYQSTLSTKPQEKVLGLTTILPLEAVPETSTSLISTPKDQTEKSNPVKPLQASDTIQAAKIQSNGTIIASIIGAVALIVATVITVVYSIYTNSNSNNLSQTLQPSPLPSITFTPISSLTPSPNYTLTIVP
jgi:hypothetical protein